MKIIKNTFDIIAIVIMLILPGFVALGILHIIDTIENKRRRKLEKDYYIVCDILHVCNKLGIGS